MPSIWSLPGDFVSPRGQQRSRGHAVFFRRWGCEAFYHPTKKEETYKGHRSGQVPLESEKKTTLSKSQVTYVQAMKNETAGATGAERNW